ncbi:Nucleoside-diphosphate-sugar epimerase [Actinopolymorpha cephalotaxi]|uniref:Nucleoside-diphosphate-sugar epimerase n=1 Tax=Actinopolymorpha cephalotaxi TaxID=504797 RepID=A0A1I2LDQ5_9ACTN|nr:NAD(P)-dependent oxidoreductase [Actinopolymorpha cephalotaxi]NYH84968.1 nucleoside-diphosphate-sugar epimerase [Actinopolymorpha cephalotaxi]SFF76678.1 Nucleoside-diphosphate-sugar epimerase [Actinopolymorpha cephalotaxi]
MAEVAVIGASGFVGAAISSQLRRSGFDVREVAAPRVAFSGANCEALLMQASLRDDLTEELSQTVAGADCVVNAAGIADATGADWPALCGANALLPILVHLACRAAGTKRFVHVSSAAVQGRTRRLDESTLRYPFSAYSRSKALAEETLERMDSGPSTVLFRPTSVHGPNRSVTRRLARLASSKATSVAGKGENPTPQVQVDNVGAAVAFVATCTDTPPEIILQPWEGLTTGELLRILGGREPRHVPTSVARSLVLAARWAGTHHLQIAGQARRLEMVWFGQDQDSGWLTAKGWRPPVGPEGWQELAAAVAAVRAGEVRTAEAVSSKGAGS